MFSEAFPRKLRHVSYKNITINPRILNPAYTWLFFRDITYPGDILLFKNTVACTGEFKYTTLIFKKIIVIYVLYNILLKNK